MKIQNDLGVISFSTDVFTDISGYAVTNCFGVKAMASRGMQKLMRMENLSKGVKVFFTEDNHVDIELHIVVEHGVNIPALSNSIMGEVRYIVEKYTGAAVGNVEVYVDSIVTE